MSSDGTTAPHLFRLWVRSGQPFQVQPRHNPIVTHDGGTTATHLVLTREEAEALRALLTAYGGNVSLEHTARQTPEQEKERLALLGAGREDTVWPSASCPGCAWFDPLLDASPCGRLGWPAETVASFVASASPKPRQDMEACPVPRLWNTQ